MNRCTRFPNRILAATVVALGALAGSAHADTHVALDFHAQAKGCPSPDRFADEVSAKLGFVPWDAQAPAALRVRIVEDRGELVGTIEQPDGTSKVLRAATCAKLDEAPVSAVAVALDRPVMAVLAAAPKVDDRRLRRLERDDDPDRLVTVQLQSRDGRELEISRVLSKTVLYGYNTSAAALQFEKLCNAPCSARLPQGTHTFLVRDIANNFSASEDATVRVNSTLELDYTSRAAARATTKSRTKWGLLIGFVAGTVATGYLVETALTDGDGSWALHSIDPLGGMITGLIGGIVGYATGPGYPADETRITVRPGLRDTTAGF